MTKQIMVGGVPVGGGAPVSIQSMCNTFTHDVDATVRQIDRLAAAGCDIVRVAVPDMAAAKAVGQIKERISIPLVVDIHFDYRLALEAIAAGADKVRINPGNIGGEDRVKAVANACANRGIPIRIGVNGGSLEKPLLAKYGKVCPEALVESAFGHIALLNKYDFADICASLKSSNVSIAMEAYRMMHERSHYPLHLGVTEAGTYTMGTIKSAIGIGGLLAQGVGDTFRVTLTADPADEIVVAKQILKAIGLRKDGPELIACPTCGKHNWTDIRQFNLMFKTFQGVTEDAKNTVYLRPETAQGIFVNFQNVQRTTRKKLPFGVCQIGKSFRNEITPGNFTFRTREFEQMELEFFCKPGTDLEWFQYWRSFCKEWLLGLNISEEHLRLRDHSPEELCFYSKGTTDFEFLFPFGWGELWGVADRTDYDLTQHQNTSGKDMTYFDQETGERYIPYVVEPSLGADRVTLAFLIEAYDEEVVGQDKKGNDDVRVVMHFHPALAPFKAAVLPLSKKEVLAGPAQELRNELSKYFMVDYDDTGSIGKRYRRQDEIGTPYCITLDFETVGDENTPADHCVTIRDRDTMEQVRIPMDQVKSWLEEKLAY